MSNTGTAVIQCRHYSWRLKALDNHHHAEIQYDHIPAVTFFFRYWLYITDVAFIQYFNKQEIDIE